MSPSSISELALPFHRAKDCSRVGFDVGSGRSMTPPQNVERGRLAASFFRGGNRQSWRMCEAFEGMGTYGQYIKISALPLGKTR